MSDLDMSLKCSPKPVEEKMSGGEVQIKSSYTGSKKLESRCQFWIIPITR